MIYPLVPFPVTLKLDFKVTEMLSTYCVYS